MLQSMGQRQQALLRLLLEHKQGLTIDDLSRALHITKTAVYQHITSLERDGLVEKFALARTGGRPSQLYALSDRGIHLFPKQYSLFARLLVRDLLRIHGQAGLEEQMARLGQELDETFRQRLVGRDEAGQLEAVAAILREVGYGAVLEGYTPGGTATFSATNCILHDLAREVPEICQLDRTLLSTLLQRPIEQTECMAFGGLRCRFHVEVAQAAVGCGDPGSTAVAAPDPHAPRCV
jgi:predicted ArsR family transcriptional regulator